MATVTGSMEYQTNFVCFFLQRLFRYCEMFWELRQQRRRKTQNIDLFSSLFQTSSLWNIINDTMIQKRTKKQWISKQKKTFKNRNYSKVSLFLHFLFSTNCYIFSIDYVHSLYTQKSFFFSIVTKESSRRAFAGFLTFLQSIIPRMVLV